MELNEWLPTFAKSVLAWSESEKDLVPMPSLPLHQLVNSPEFVKEVLHTKSAAFTRDTQLVYWEKVLSEVPGEHPQLLVDLATKSTLGNADCMPAIWQQHFKNSRENCFQEVPLAISLLSYFLAPHANGIEEYRLAGFHEAATYFEQTRADGAQRLQHHVVYHENARNQLVENLLVNAGVSKKEAAQLPIKYRDLYAAVIHSAYRSALNLLGWCLYVLAHKPHYFTAFKALDETQLTKELHPFIFEVLRLFPSAWMLHRVVIEPVSLGQHHLNVGDQLQLSPLCFHRDARYFENPTEFDPSRFISKNTMPWTYFPFGGGQFSCPGKNVALTLCVSFLKAVLPVGKVQCKQHHSYKENSVPISLNPFRLFRFEIV